MPDSILLTVTRIETMRKGGMLSTATGFFFMRDERLYLVTSRHVFCDEATGHAPDAFTIDIHIDAKNLANTVSYSIPLLKDGGPLWRQGTDGAGEVDVAAIELDRSRMPADMVFQPFTPDHILAPAEKGSGVDIGAPLLAVGFPLGFHDTLHRMPVARHATLATSFGLRFQGYGYFLTDARTHRGISGAPIVVRRAAGASPGGMPWALIGVHSASFDMANRVQGVDDTLGLNVAWYADILLTLTENAG